MKILSWNYCGVSNPRAIPNLRSLDHKHKPGVIFISEILEKTQRLESIRVVLSYNYFLVVDVKGRSSGFAVLWDDSVQFQILNYSRYFVKFFIQDDTKGEWRLTCCYGYLERSKHHQSWDMLGTLRDMSDAP